MLFTIAQTKLKIGGLKGGKKRLKKTVVCDRKNGRIEMWEEATQRRSGFRWSIVAFNKEDFDIRRFK